MEYSLQKKRTSHYVFIDIAKGFGIFFIVMGHIVPIQFLKQLLYAFHVPLFFIISGLTYKAAVNKQKFFINKFIRLVIPYFIFAVISIVIYYFMSQIIHLKGDPQIIPNILGMLYANSNSGYMTWNRPLWFLPCMFVSHILLDMGETIIRNKNLNNPQLFRVFLVCLLWSFGIILNCSIDSLYLPLHLESAVFLTGFSELGIILSKPMIYYSQKRIYGTNRPIIVFSICATSIVIGCILSNINGTTDIRTHSFGENPCLLIITAILFSLAILILSITVKNNRFLAYAGVSSMSILLMHKFPILFFQEIVPCTQGVLATQNTFIGTTIGIFLSVIIILMCLAADYIITRICPIVVGKPTNQNRIRSAYAKSNDALK